MNEKVWLVLFKFEGKIYVAVQEDGVTLAGYLTKKNACDAFEIPYEECHARSYESSMSAAIHNIFFSPRVVEMNGIDDIRARLFNDTQKFFTSKCSCVAGRMVGMACDQEKAQAIYSEAISPRLIQNKAPAVGAYGN